MGLVGYRSQAPVSHLYNYCTSKGLQFYHFTSFSACHFPQCQRSKFSLPNSGRWLLVFAFFFGFNLGFGFVFAIRRFGSRTFAFRFFPQKDFLDVWKDAPLRDCHALLQFVQFIIMANSHLDVSRNYSRLPVVSSSISSQFHDFSCQVLENCSQVNWCARAYTISIVASAEHTMNSAHWKVQTALLERAFDLSLTLRADILNSRLVI